MKKTTLTIRYDEEKLSAMRMYMTKKSSALDDELLATLDRLYEKYVPSGVRDFISERYGDDSSQNRCVEDSE